MSKRRTLKQISFPLLHMQRKSQNLKNVVRESYDNAICSAKVIYYRYSLHDSVYKRPQLPKLNKQSASDESSKTSNQNKCLQPHYITKKQPYNRVFHSPRLAVQHITGHQGALEKFPRLGFGLLLCKLAIMAFNYGCKLVQNRFRKENGRQNKA